MSVHGVVDYIDLAAGEPLVVRLGGVVEDLGVGLGPISIGLSHLIPELNVIIRAPLRISVFSLEPSSFIH